MLTPEARDSRIRAARVQDADELACLATELGYETADIAKRLGQLLCRDDHFIIVACGDDDHLLGTVTAERRSLLLCGLQVEIMGLIVGAGARRRGVGKALIGGVEDWGRQLGVEHIVVRSNVVRPDSHPFYEGIGYRRDKTQHVYSKSLGKSVFA